MGAPVPLHVRDATLDDAAAIADLHVRSWRAHYVDFAPREYLERLDAAAHEREYWRPLLAEPPDGARVWVAEVDGVPAGFANIEPATEDGAWPVPPHCGWLHHIHLAPEHVGRGVGRALFGHALDALRVGGFTEGALWVYEANRLARRFYDAAGWRADGARNTRNLGGLDVPQVRYRGPLTGA
jgi:GNAT superfamily N-acetyltransferase